MIPGRQALIESIRLGSFLSPFKISNLEEKYKTQKFVPLNEFSNSSTDYKKSAIRYALVLSIISAGALLLAILEKEVLGSESLLSFMFIGLAAIQLYLLYRCMLQSKRQNLGIFTFKRGLVIGVIFGFTTSLFSAIINLIIFSIWNPIPQIDQFASGGYGLLASIGLIFMGSLGGLIYAIIPALLVKSS